MYFGCAWYPEHWPQEQWSEDCRLMAKAGMNVVRVGEFAWSRLEPARGDFQFDWLKRAVDCAAEHGLATVIGTPTAAPPAWLTAAHPEVLPVRADGRVHGHGQRGHYDPSSILYRGYCEKIATALGERFGQHESVIGWQVDNEFWSIPWGTSAVLEFRDWLRLAFGTLEALNSAWSTAYWSQEYSSWNQIDPPSGNPNPCLRLAWYRFASEICRDFCKVQVDALRRVIDRAQWITHNFHPFDELDRAAVADELDFVSWDAYAWGPRDGAIKDPASCAADIDRMRGLLDSNIWVMETQPGFVNWTPHNHCQPPGALRAAAWQMVGHGADAVLYWQWRPAPGGQEQYHGTVVAVDGSPRPVYDEIARLGSEFAATAPALSGTAPDNRVAIIDSWADRWALTWQPFGPDSDPVEHVLEWYRPFQRGGYGVDILERLVEQPDYDLLVAPHLHLVADDTAELLRAWVQAGGHLILGPRSLHKNADNALRRERPPGPLADLIGARLGEYYALPEPVAVGGSLGRGTVSRYLETLIVADEATEVLLASAESGDWWSGSAVVVSRSAGAGRLTWCGTHLDQDLAQRLAAWATRGFEAPPLVPAPGVEICPRQGDERRLLVVINHNHGPVCQPLPRPFRCMLNGQRYVGELAMPAHGVALLVDADA